MADAYGIHKRRSGITFLIFYCHHTRLTNARYYSITFYGLQLVTLLSELLCDLSLRLFSDFTLATLTVGHVLK